jgi:diaminopimelate decarboxylase
VDPRRVGAGPEVSAAVFPRTAVVDGARLLSVGGVACTDLAATYGTPLYVLDEAELVGRLREYRAAFGAEVAVAYAAKALCVVGVLQLAAAEGMHLDVSTGEFGTGEANESPSGRHWLGTDTLARMFACERPQYSAHWPR